MDLEPSFQWLQLQADDYSATVSLQTLHRHPDSLLAGLADTALAHGRDVLRLDMSAEVAREVVAVLRLGESYTPPADSRLLTALKHTLDYLGLPSPPRLPIRFPLSQPYLFVHSYSCEVVEEAGRDCGLLLYSTQGGWAALDGEGPECGDPRPANMDPQWYYAATTLQSECTGAGQDLMLVAGPESVSSYVMEADSRRCHTVPSCKGHTGPCVSVQGKAYMLGRHGAAAVSCFDPCVNCWFTTAPMRYGMYDFCAVSPPGSTLVLTFGGVCSSTGRHRDGIDLFDPRQRGWTSSGARLTRPSRGLAAAPVDEYRVLVFGGSGGRAANIVDLRNWRLLPAGELSAERQHMAGVAFEGGVLSLGGVDEHEQFVDIVERYDAVTNQWQVIGRLPCAMSHMTVASARVSTALQLNQMPVIESAASRRACTPAR